MQFRVSKVLKLVFNEIRRKIFNMIDSILNTLCRFEFGT